MEDEWKVELKKSLELRGRRGAYKDLKKLLLIASQFRKDPGTFERGEIGREVIDMILDDKRSREKRKIFDVKGGKRGESKDW